MPLRRSVVRIKKHPATRHIEPGGVLRHLASFVAAAIRASGCRGALCFIKGAAAAA
jgi:hypothetical protein